MNLGDTVDVAFDFRSDTPAGRDPDADSPTLRRYHRFLWSKPLPSGVAFELDTVTPRTYLHHWSELGEFGFSSDAVIPTFSRNPKLQPLFDQIPVAETEEFNRIAYTIGGMMIFPGYKVDGHMTINQRRGCHPRIKDRFDLTVECIRRHYRGEDSPLADTLDRYSNFFELFEDFNGYVEFFLLQDLVTEAGDVRFAMSFQGFDASPLPGTLSEYLAYRENSIEFIEARNRRIAAYAVSQRRQEG